MHRVSVDCFSRISIGTSASRPSCQSLQGQPVSIKQSRQLLQASPHSLATDAPSAAPSPAGDASVAQSAGLHPKLQIAAVTTVAEFSEAVNTGARYIEIRAHLDLRGLKPVNSSGPLIANPDLDVSTSYLVYTRRSIQSLTVRASSTPYLHAHGNTLKPML